ncbi:adenosine deaminase/editase, partial [Biscogniauxia marginata]
MTVTADLIASLVQKQYDELPAKRKPVVRDNGLYEWVPLSGIVAQGRDNKLKCVSLATGMKCLPSAKLSEANGNVLHDWHAEILAIRAFNRFVLDECKALAQGTATTSDFLRFRTREEMSMGRSQSESDSGGSGDWHGQPFTWREDVLLHMYCSEAPCGDASMELTMAAQEDATPWAVVPDPNLTLSSALLPGRAYFSELGIVRRKPSRGDAPTTLSKSCSDKLALKQCTSLLCSLASLLVSPEHAYISTLVLPGSQFAAEGCRRAFSAEGRMRSCTVGRGSSSNGWPGGYSFRPFAVETTTEEFVFSKRQVTTAAAAGHTRTETKIPSSPAPVRITSSNLAVAWTTTHTSSDTGTVPAITAAGQEESTLSGVLQGRRQTDVRGASFASRRRLWALAVEVVELLRSGPATIEIPRGGFVPLLDEKKKQKVDEVEKKEEENWEEGPMTYGAVKDSAALGARRLVKEEVRREALRGWVRNAGDENFTLEDSI